jgi:hypothetical protein
MCAVRRKMWPVILSEEQGRFESALRNAEEFFMGGSKVQAALEELAAALEELNIPYAIAGAMALNAYGYERVTADVDVLLTREGLERLKAEKLGRGYVEKFPGSRGLRDTAHGVNIDVLITGDYPGDGAPKPVAFPDPQVAEQTGKYRLLPLATLVELKLASGMTAPHRLKDLADVLELIRARGLPESFADSLHPYVRQRYLELHKAAAQAPREE